jgi:hypothetical protein
MGSFVIQMSIQPLKYFTFFTVSIVTVYKMLTHLGRNVSYSVRQSVKLMNYIDCNEDDKRVAIFTAELYYKT